LRKVIYIICCAGILFGCAKSKKQERIQTKNGKLMVYDLDQLIRNNECEIIRIENDSSVIFKYKNLIDSTKSLQFSYLKADSMILFGPDKFVKTEDDVLIEELNFDRYELIEQYPDGMGPVIFNFEYGVLAFNNGWGMEFHLLTDKNKGKLKFPLIYKMEQKQ